MWIVCITSVRHVLTVNGYGGRQTKENEKSWCFKGWETLVKHKGLTKLFYLVMLMVLSVFLNFVPDNRVITLSTSVTSFFNSSFP